MGKWNGKTYRGHYRGQGCYNPGGGGQGRGQGQSDPIYWIPRQNPALENVTVDNGPFQGILEHCGDCGEKIYRQVGWKGCPFCLVAFKKMKGVCPSPKCRHHNLEGIKFCTKCGTKLEETPTGSGGGGGGNSSGGGNNSGGGAGGSGGAAGGSGKGVVKKLTTSMQKVALAN